MLLRGARRNGLVVCVWALCATLAALAADVNVCMPFSADADPEGAAQTECQNRLNTARGASSSITSIDNFVCNYGGSDEGCMQRIEDGEDDITTFGGDQLFRAHRDHGLIAYVAEQYSSEGGPMNSYYAVAVVKASRCKERDGPLSTLRDLKGKKSCHTGYRKTAGWVLPMGYMMNRGIIEVKRDDAVSRNMAVDAESVKQFFGEICAPGTTPEGPSFVAPDTENGRPRAVQDDELCAGCDNASGQPCSRQQSENKYADYTGAFQCMVDGGEVAFVKHTTFDDWNGENGGSNSRDDYRLLCGRGCEPLDAYKKCNLGEAPAKALVGRSAWKTSNVGRDVMSLFNGNDDLLGRTQRLGNRQNFLFSRTAKSLTSIDSSVSFKGRSDSFFKSYAQFEAISALSKIKVCMPFEDSDGTTKRACEEALNFFAASLRAPDHLNTQLPVAFQCTARGTAEECMRMVKLGAARGGDDFVVLGGDQMYTAHKFYGLNAFVAEKYSQESGDPLNSYFSVAVVKASKCAGQSNGLFESLESLQGVKSCHTGYRKTAGWVLPMGRLIDEEIMPVRKEDAIQRSISVDAAAAVAFFKRDGVCAAGTTADGPAEGGEVYEPLCRAGCNSRATAVPEGDRCKGTSDNPYYGYRGAFQCLVDTEADGETAVAFVKHTTFDDYPDAGWGSKSEYRILCDSGCKRLDEFRSCNLGEAPSHALMASDEFAASSMGKEFIAKATDDRAGNNFLTRTRSINGHDDFLWQPETELLERITGSFQGSANSFFQSYAQFDKIRTLGQEVVRFCAPFQVSDRPRFISRCNEFLGKYNRDNVEWRCVVGGDARTCMRMVRDGEAELTKFGGNELFTANAEFQLEPVVAEVYEGTDTASYKAVAVMRKSDCETLAQNLASGTHPFSSLEGMKSCHTGYRKTAGWVLPVGTLFDLGIMSRTEVSGVRADAASVENFFGSVCAPGVTDEGPRIGGTKYPGLCSHCREDCSKDDPFEGYEGALRCLLEEEGEVAWVKHTTALQRPKSQRDELRLLCPSASSTANMCREVERWDDCSYATAPGHAYMGRRGWHKTVAGKAAIQGLEMASEDPLFLELTTFDDLEDFPLQSSALSMQRVQDPSDFSSYFGPEALRAFRSIRSLDAEQDASQSSGGSSSGLSGGEIAGIVVACVVGVPLIILIVVLIVKKSRGGGGMSMPRLKNPFRRSAPANTGEGYKVYNPTMDFNGGRMPPPVGADAIKV